MNKYSYAKRIFQQFHEIQWNAVSNADTPIILSIKEFEVYLDGLLQQIVPQTYNTEYLIGCVYTKRTFKKVIEYEGFAKSQLQVGIQSFKELIQVIETEPSVDNTTLMKYADKIRNYLFDLKEYIEYFERRKDSNFILFEGRMNKKTDTSDLFRDVKTMFWSSKVNYDSASQNISVFLIRQSLEVKFKRVLGFIDVYDEETKSLKTRHDFFATFINNNKANFEIPTVPITYILKIYDWCNYTIHNAINPRIWEIQYAISIIEAWFKPGFTATDTSTSFSRYGAVKVMDYYSLRNKLAKELDQLIERSNRSEGKEGKIYCIAFALPESIIL
jgi:hypothetical protein